MSAIYLGCPYSHPRWMVREYRYQMACKVAGRLMIAGHVVYSPLSHGHPISAVTPRLPTTWAFWREQDFWFLERAAKLLILALPGWEKSEGLQDEIKLAAVRGIEIEHELPTPEELLFGERILKSLCVGRRGSCELLAEVLPCRSGCETEGVAR